MEFKKLVSGFAICFGFMSLIGGVLLSFFGMILKEYGLLWGGIFFIIGGFSVVLSQDKTQPQKEHKR